MVTRTQNTKGNGRVRNNHQRWKKKCIKDICESIVDCINKTAPTVDYTTEYKMIRTNNVRDGYINLSDIKYVTKDVFDFWTRRLTPRRGDVILTREAPLGEVGMITTDDYIFLGQHLMQYRANSRYLDNRFLLYTFQEHSFQQRIKMLGSGATVEHIKVPEAENLMLWLPPLHEQQAIATALSDVDALIASLDKLIAKKRDIKQATMHQLLTGKIRLPGFSAKWEVKELGNVVETILGGGTPRRSKPEYWEGDISWVTVKDFATFDPYSTQESITKAGLQNSSSNLIKKGTLITSTRMAIGKAIIYKIDVSINQDLKALFLKKDINTLFMFYWFEQNAKNIENLGSGSTVKGISLSDLKKLSFHEPPTIIEQNAIAAVLSNMDAEISALEQRRDKTRALKQGMMQELLTGKTRLI